MTAEKKTKTTKTPCAFMVAYELSVNDDAAYETVKYALEREGFLKEITLDDIHRDDDFVLPKGIVISLLTLKTGKKIGELVRRVVKRVGKSAKIKGLEIKTMTVSQIDVPEMLCWS